MISTATIEEVKSRVDIVDVVGDFVSLKRSGQNYKALSPFTNEKTASFYVVPSKGIFKDFSSGKGGDAITFVMEHEGLSYTETIRFLAKKYGVEIQDEAVSAEQLAQQSERDGLYIVMNYAKEYYHDLLFNHEEGQSIGLSYFHERGFHDRTIKEFELGYSLNEWDHLTKAALQKGFSQSILEKAGLTISKEGGKVYDRFRGRVIFPVHNLSGKIIAFGARILTKEKGQPKYINSPETDIYHKGNVLYGLYQAKNAIRRDDVCFLVEGYTDVISLHLAGVDNVVSSSGTALTEEQIKLIRRFTENVTVLFDGDAAGIKAALRGIDLVLKGGLNVRVVLFPDGEDPDSFSRKKGSTEFKQFLAGNQKDFISFKIDLFSAEASKDPIKKAELIREMVKSISVIPDPLKRTIYLQECSKELEVPLSVLSIEVKKILLANRTSDRQAENTVSRDYLVESLSEIHTLSKSFLLSADESLDLFEREFIKVLINHGYQKVNDEEFVFDYLFKESQDVTFLNQVHQDIIDHYKGEVANGNDVKPARFISTLPTHLSSYVSDFLVQKYFISDGWKTNHIIIGNEYEVEKAPYKIVMQLKFGIVVKMLNDNLQKIKEASSHEEETELMGIQYAIDNYKNEIASGLGRVILPSVKLVQND